MYSKRILFINFGGIGDEVLFLPSILSVKKQFPDSYIALALEKRSGGIMELTDVIDELIFAEIKKKNKIWELIKLLFKIWGGKYDLVISSGSNKCISIFLFLTFIKEKYGYNTGFLSRIFLTKSVDLNKEQYAVNMYHDLVKHVTDIKTELPKFTVERQTVVPNSVLVHPGVSKMSVQKGMIKTIPAEEWARVVEQLSESGKRVYLTGGNDDRDVIDTITKLVPAEKYENLYGSTESLKELAEQISRAEIFICSDSAPLHIAVGLGVKTYAIFGSTDDKRLLPVNGSVTAIKADCKCPLRPCLWEKRQTTCEDLFCLRITAEEILQKVLNN